MLWVMLAIRVTNDINIQPNSPPAQQSPVLHFCSCFMLSTLTCAAVGAAPSLQVEFRCQLMPSLHQQLGNGATYVNVLITHRSSSACCCCCNTVLQAAWRLSSTQLYSSC
jgi:hypothetical protein